MTFKKRVIRELHIELKLTGNARRDRARVRERERERERHRDTDTERDREKESGRERERERERERNLATISQLFPFFALFVHAVCPRIAASDVCNT